VNESIGQVQSETTEREEWGPARQSLWEWIETLTVEDTKDILRILCQHEASLATHDLDFGGDVFGVNSNTPTDLMHAYLLGVVRYAITAMVKVWPPRLKAALDNLAETVLQPQSQAARSDYPRCDFTHGLSNLTLLTAQEWGVAFSYYILLSMRKGKEIVKDVIPNYDIDKVVNERSLEGRKSGSAPLLAPIIRQSIYRSVGATVVETLEPDLITTIRLTGYSEAIVHMSN
jgi:hypothetical protein